MDQQIRGDFSGWSAVVTFESDRGEPTCVRTEIVDSEPDVAARKAVFRALSEGKPRKYESVVIVLTRIAHKRTIRGSDAPTAGDGSAGADA
jgi:hypothetical protein